MTNGRQPTGKMDLNRLHLHVRNLNRAQRFYNSFHEKAGASQDGLVFSSVGLWLLSRAASVAILPSALFVERFVGRCQLGVLVSAGAAT